MNCTNRLRVALTVLGIACTAAVAQPAQGPQGQGAGPGMGQGMGQGMGPGMMRGPGWQGGYRDDDSWGRGMRGGWGGGGMMDGMGMMGLGPINRLDLTDSQRKEVLKIQDELRRTNWTVMGSMHDERSKFREAMWAGKRDRAAILAASKRMSDLHQQMLENALNAFDKAEAVLTPQQREQLRREVW